MGVKGVKRVWPDLDAEIRRTRAGLRAARGDVLELTEREQLLRCRIIRERSPPFVITPAKSARLLMSAADPTSRRSPVLPLARRVFVGTWRTGASPVEPVKQALQYVFSCGVPIVVLTAGAVQEVEVTVIRSAHRRRLRSQNSPAYAATSSTATRSSARTSSRQVASIRSGGACSTYH